jgi:hypothetical protein
MALGLCAALMCGLLGGCGGGSTTASNSGGSSGSGTSTPQTVQGFATPKSVAVVTATNAN